MIFHICIAYHFHKDHVWYALFIKQDVYTKYRKKQLSLSNSFVILSTFTIRFNSASGTIIPEPGSLIGDLLDMDIGGGGTAVPRGMGGAPAPDLLGGGLDQLLAGGPPDPSVPGAAANNLLGDIFGMGTASTHTGYIPDKQVWLTAAKVGRTINCMNVNKKHCLK